MAKVTRTVKPNLIVTIDGDDWEPLGPHAEGLMMSWVGMRVEVQDANYWGTRKHCALRLPGHDVAVVATLHSPTNKPREASEGDRHD